MSAMINSSYPGPGPFEGLLPSQIHSIKSAKIAASRRQSFQRPFAGSSLTLGTAHSTQGVGTRCFRAGICSTPWWQPMRNAACGCHTLQSDAGSPRTHNSETSNTACRLEQGRISASLRQGASRSRATGLCREQGCFPKRPEVLQVFLQDRSWQGWFCSQQACGV